MKETLSIRILYRTPFGRTLLKYLTKPEFSQRMALFFSSKASIPLIRVFIRKNRIDMSQYQQPEQGYTSFNDFFTRKKKESIPLQSDHMLLSPCDGFLTVAPISKSSVFSIKHTEYTVRSLLKDQRLAEKYHGGTALIFRLTPSHYHRYIYCTGGSLTGSRRIHGILHSVRPICHENSKVFVQNSREYCNIHNPQMGDIIQMEIGALLVGKIANIPIPIRSKVRAGQEKGYFEYGGSSIVLLVTKEISLSPKILTAINSSTEMPVKVGTPLL